MTQQHVDNNELRQLLVGQTVTIVSVESPDEIVMELADGRMLSIFPEAYEIDGWWMEFVK